MLIKTIFTIIYLYGLGNIPQEYRSCENRRFFLKVINLIYELKKKIKTETYAAYSKSFWQRKSEFFPYVFHQSHLSALMSTGSDASVEINV